MIARWMSTAITLRPDKVRPAISFDCRTRGARLDLRHHLSVISVAGSTPVFLYPQHSLSAERPHR
jgi:hypothetical protein